MSRLDYLKAVGYEAGYGSDPDVWTDEQSYNVERCVDAGLSDFYFPTLDGRLYEWSFLSPVRQFAVLSGAVALPLPDDFNGFLVPSLQLLRDSDVYPPVRLGDAVRRLSAGNPSAQGPPRAAEVVLRAPDLASRSARYELQFWPQADQSYTLEGRMSVAPEALSERRPHVYGGPAHHQTVLSACLAAFESLIDNDQAGPHRARFLQRLAASVAQDRRNKPKTLGYNRDASDLRHYGGGGSLYWGKDVAFGNYSTVTIDDQTP